MDVALRLTDHQRAVLQRLCERSGRDGIDALAARAVDHAASRPPEPRWAQPRPQRSREPARPSDVHLDAVLPAASAVAIPLDIGRRLRLVQLTDGQCVDLAAYLADGRAFSAARTRSIEGVSPSVGASLWSTPPHVPLLTIVADSAPGHDLGFPACSEQEYRDHTGLPGHLGCAELHAGARAAGGLAPCVATDEVLNLWLPAAVDPDGHLRSWPAACRRGDFVELEAQRDLVAVISTCPDDLFGSSQYAPSPVRVVVAGGRAQPVSRHSGAWPEAAPVAALNRHRMAVTLDEARLAIVDAVVAGGWLGSSRAAVVRALIFRWHESSRLGGGEIRLGRPGQTAACAPASSRASSHTASTGQLIS